MRELYQIRLDFSTRDIDFYVNKCYNVSITTEGGYPNGKVSEFAGTSSSSVNLRDGRDGDL